MDRKEGGGGVGRGRLGGVAVLTRVRSGEGEMGRVRLRGGNREGEGGNGKREMGRGQRGGGKEGARGDFTDGYDEMSGWIYGMFGWNEAKFFSDFVHPCNAGYPS